MTLRKFIAAAAAASSIALTAPAHAESETGSVQVSATLTAACFIGDGTLAFGNITSIAQGGTAGTKASAADTSADTGGIKYVCSNGASATLGIAGANDESGQLQMVNGSSHLAYNIYTDADHTAQVVPGVTNVALTEDGNNQTITLYGVVPGATANQPIGTYADTLTLTVTY